MDQSLIKLQPSGFPEDNGLYSSENEHDACGVGFVANIKGHPSHQTILDADRINRQMHHRGACGCEENTGDGAGILTALPHKFLRRVVKAELGIDLPEAGQYGAGIVYFPKDKTVQEEFKKIVAEHVAKQGLKLLGWRNVPQDPVAANIGPSALSVEPDMQLILIGAPEGIDQQTFERKLFVVRKTSSHAIRTGKHALALQFYICTLSTRIIVYKGMFTPAQVLPYYPDLQDEDYESHLAMVHSRFSTNTFPSWDRAQPLRCIAHNGEINTVKGNSNWMFARQGALQSELFGEDLETLFPVVEAHGSDSGNFDNVMELLYHGGRDLPDVAMMMIPEAWQNHHAMPEEKRAFYEYHSALMEPWDGPASVSFTDGRFIGACLDRNGLRPSRFYVTHDDQVIMASEVGVLEVPPENVKLKGRLQPGKMFLVDFEQGRLIPDEELKHAVASRRPYGEWLKNQRLELRDLRKEWQANGGQISPIRDSDLLKMKQAFGYTTETMQFMLLPLVNAKKDPIYSMGDDASLACLSDQPRPLYDYFKQLFAQVTNPPIDSIREEVIMSLECYIGPEGNLFDTAEKQCHRLRVPHPILTDEELAALKNLNGGHGWKTKTIDATWPKSEGTAGLLPAIQRVCQEAQDAIAEGYSLVILSDRATGPDRVGISSLLACGAVHHHLVRQELRTRIGLILESAEAREVHHFCLLTGYGADAINPYLAFDTLRDARNHGHLNGDYTEEKIVMTYREGISKGMLKVMGKMGISTLQSYKGAQIFEALGLSPEVVELCFRGTASRIRGIGFEILAEETLRRHEMGYPSRTESTGLPVLANMGLVHWRHGGEKHGWNPFTIAEIQQAARAGDKGAYKRFATLVNESSHRQGTLRGLMRFKAGTPISIDEVEPAKEIVKRFCSGAMSYGSISAEAHETIAIAMNRLGGKSNTGEGGEDYERFNPLANGDTKRSAIKQVASGRFGVTSWYLTNADEIQIKMAQGAKPGEGGELPGHKVDKTIAATRHATPGVGLISPPPHHDIYSIEDLSQLIYDLKNSNPSARVSVKLVSEVGVGTVAAGVSKGHADKILVSGDGGGTGASPLTSIKHAGLPWELGIAEAHQTLVMNDLRSRVRLETDGQLRTGRDVAIACMLGAEEFGFATAPLITLGCIMMRKCHLNTCPVGVATQDPELRKRFTGQPEHVVNYLFMVAEDLREVMASLGFRSINEMVGRADMLEWNSDVDHWKAKHLDLSPVLKLATSPYPNAGRYCTQTQNHGLEETLDQQLLIPSCREAIDTAQPKLLDVNIQNIDRSFGTTLSHEISKKWGPEGLPEDTIRLRVRGSAGQSLGAFGVKGLTIEVIGDANDYVGKGLSGAKIIVAPPEESSFTASNNIIIGNVALYGATSGEAYFRGIAAERFCVRNSGAKAVVEGVGDHGLEYMTGGCVVVLGPTGRNFAAGMSGGYAFVLTNDIDELRLNTNLELVEFESVEELEDVELLRSMLTKHQKYTGSSTATEILENWDKSLPKFVKVMPRDYKRALAERKAEAAAEAAGEESPVHA
ncbi:glutamate synthase large subunit [Planctomicrobium sp. SH668]|uniref:glutamate synthase large subunit n=1 Tax=Planctomicrobium sp. SH668 TaxID=3448126 RepID=UPI003F5BFE75